MSADKSNKSNNRNKIRRILLIIGGVILVIYGSIHLKEIGSRVSNAGLYADYYMPPANEYVEIKGTPESDIAKAFYAYEKRQYESAIVAFENLDLEQRDIGIDFYKAICFAEIDNPIKAINLLSRIKRFESDYTAKAYWYLALFQMRRENDQQAITNLQDFIELTESQEWRQKSIDLLKILMNKPEAESK